MPWFSKQPDLKNNPLYLEPRVTANETSLAQNAKYEMFPSLNVIDLEGMTVGNIVLVRYNVKLGNVILA